MAIALAAILCLGSGWLLVSLGWARTGSRGVDFLLRSSLSVGFGLGIFSVTFLISRILGIGAIKKLDVTVFVLLALLLLWRRSRKNSAYPEIEASGKLEHWPRWFQRMLAGAFGLAFAVAIFSSVKQALALPHGWWDAFAIWNLHARFLYLGGANWRDGFSARLPWSHPDYGLLLSASIAHFWSYLGWDDPAVGAVIGWSFIFAAVGVLFSSLRVLRGKVAALLGALTLLATPAYIGQGTWQYADIPLSFFYLAAIALLALHEESILKPEARGWPGFGALAGLAAGFGAWTKNEGVLFLCALIVARQLTFLRARRKAVKEETKAALPAQSFARHSGALLAGTAPMIVLIVYFKRSIAPPGDLFSDPAIMLRKLADPRRYWIVAQWYVKSFLRFGHWVIPATLLLLGLYIVLRRSGEWRLKAGDRASILALVLTLAGYFGVYVITPHDIYWHLRFSLDRLFLQVWPSAIFLFFLRMPGMRQPIKTN